MVEVFQCKRKKSSTRDELFHLITHCVNRVQMGRELDCRRKSRRGCGIEGREDRKSDRD